MATKTIRVNGKCSIEVYCDGVLIYAGDIQGSRQIPYNPSPGQHTYIIKFIPTSVFGGYTSQRTVMLMGFKKA